MLPPQQIAEAERKLKLLQLQEEIKNKNKKFSKTVNDAIISLKEQPKKQHQIIRNLINTDVLQKKISFFEALNTSLQELQQKMNQKREQFNKDESLIAQQEGKIKKSIEQIKQNMSVTRKSAKEIVQQGTSKRMKLQDDLERSIQKIANKVMIFQAEAQKLSIENAQLQNKVIQHQSNFCNMQENFKVKDEAKDQQLNVLRQNLTKATREQENERQKTATVNKQYSEVQKRIFEGKIALAVKSRKFPQLAVSLKGFANTLNSCKLELLNVIQRINLAEQQIQQKDEMYEQLYNLQLTEMRKQQVLEGKIQQIIKEKEHVKAHIAQLQKKLKLKKSRAEV